MASSLLNEGQCVLTVRSTGLTTPDSLFDHMRQRLENVARSGWRFSHIAVEVSHERNPRMANNANRVQVTCRNPAGVVRAECSDATPAAAFDGCMEHLQERLRRLSQRQKDRRHGRYGHARALADNGVGALPETFGASTTTPTNSSDHRSAADAEIAVRIARVKSHPAAVMSVIDAIDAMESIGHAFYLFIDAETREPAVVYQRKGFTYGVVKLCEAVKQGESESGETLDIAGKSHGAPR